MIVSCPKCSANYKVPDEKIPATGAKLQCSRCGQGFRIELPAAQAETELATSSVIGFEDEQQTAGLHDSTEDPGSLFGTSEDLDAGPAAENKAPPKERSALSDLFDEDALAATHKNETPDFDWDDEADYAHSEAPPEFTSVADGIHFAPALSLRDGSQVFAASTRTAPEKGRQMQRRVFSRRLRRQLSFLTFVGLISIVGGGLALRPELLLNFPIRAVARMFGELLGLSEKPRVRQGSPRIAAAAKSYYEITTMKGERMLVIDGIARNASEDVVSYIRVSADVYTASGELVTSTTVYAGNPLNKIQLKTFGMVKISEKLQREFGDNLENMNVPPGKVLPFTAVIFPVPGDYDNIKARAFVSGNGK